MAWCPGFALKQNRKGRRGEWQRMRLTEAGRPALELVECHRSSAGCLMSECVYSLLFSPFIDAQDVVYWGNYDALEIK